MSPGLWEELVCTRWPGGPLWLSAPLALWRTEPGWAGLLWVRLLEAVLRAVEELLRDS